MPSTVTVNGGGTFGVGGSKSACTGAPSGPVRPANATCARYSASCAKPDGGSGSANEIAAGSPVTGRPSTCTNSAGSVGDCERCATAPGETATTAVFPAGSATSATGHASAVTVPLSASIVIAPPTNAAGSAGPE